ncbi:7-cyano-7-deazaguanine synthase [Rhizobium leguminosarum]|uniref:7-cyano-7-deazaguanine synthase n=1 Tax=Rhizobium leguminosarum TaxID=384 RepID=UPI0009B6BF4F
MRGGCARIRARLIFRNFAGSKGIPKIQIGLTKDQFRTNTHKFMKTAGNILNFFEPTIAPVAVEAPFAGLTKSGVIKLADSSGVDLKDTWSCGMNGPIQCGACPSCVARKTAFVDAGVVDTTNYENP